jgi:hypothetical protein
MTRRQGENKYKTDSKKIQSAKECISLPCDVIFVEKVLLGLTGLVADDPVEQLGRVARVQEGGTGVKLAQLALSRELAIPIGSVISTTTTKQGKTSDFPVSHRRKESFERQFDNKIAGYLRDLVLFLPGIHITKAVEGHMRADEPWPTSVFHECRQRDGIWGVLSCR